MNEKLEVKIRNYGITVEEIKEELNKSAEDFIRNEKTGEPGDQVFNLLVQGFLHFSEASGWRNCTFFMQ